MNQIAKQLDDLLRTLDPELAKRLEAVVREAIERVAPAGPRDAASGWPVGYFEQTAGALAGEDFERPPQGELPRRDDC